VTSKPYVRLDSAPEHPAAHSTDEVRRLNETIEAAATWERTQKIPLGILQRLTLVRMQLERSLVEVYSIAGMRLDAVDANTALIEQIRRGASHLEQALDNLTPPLDE
jgi:hypothetical protein